MTKTNNIKPRYRNTPIGVIPEDWEVKKFEEISEIDKKSLPASTAKDYEFDYISLSDISSAEFKIGSTRQKFSTAPSRARKIVAKNDILMSTVRPNLQGFAIIKNNVENLIASTGFAVITPNKCNSNFLYHYLFSEAISKQFHQLLVGSNYPAINSSDVRNLKLPLPPLSEQRTIAEVLSTWDKAIEQQETLLQQYELRKKWLMQNLLTGKKRLEGFEGEWEEMKMSDLFYRVTRKNEEGSTNVVTISAQRGFVRQTDFFNKSVASKTLDNYFLVEKDEFCYNKSYSNGYPWGATKRLKDFEKAVVTTLYICFGIKDHQKTNVDFFEHFFEANSLDRGLTRIAHEGGRAHGLLNVRPADFFALKISVPSTKEQTAIAEILQTADKEIELTKQRIEKLREQKKGLMQQLLTGKVRLVSSEK